MASQRLRQRFHGKSQKRTCLLLSGGLDSSLLLDSLLKQRQYVAPIYIRCGLKWEKTELYWLNRFLKTLDSSYLEALEIVDIPLHSVYRSHWSVSGRGVPGFDSLDEAVFLPGRNLLLLSIAAIHAVERDFSTVTLGILKGNPFGDATPRFFSQLASCFKQALSKSVRILTPLRRSSKPQLIKAAAYGFPFAFTFSCLRPQGHRHCGRCNKCAERQRAFRQAHVPDPTNYAH